jgi:sugar phosphate isomerase/epimerase
MHLGIFAKTFPRPKLEATLDAIAEQGLTHVQFNMTCAGLPTLPERLDEDFCIWIARSFRERGLTMAAISGTFNLCDPDESRLEENLHRLGALASACRWLDTRIITLCTGTRDAEDMWKWHPENVRRTTWDALVQAVRRATKIADRYEVTLAFEPEIHDIVNSVARARMLLDQIGSSWLKVVIDPASLMHPGDFPRVAEILDEAFDWLGSDIVLAHAKDPDLGYSREETIAILDAWKHRHPRAPGLPFFGEEQHYGTRDYLDPKTLDKLKEVRIPRYLDELQSFYCAYVERLYSINYAGALILHGLPEAEVDTMHVMIDGLVHTLRED